jgi:hypothetical protein
MAAVKVCSIVNYVDAGLRNRVARAVSDRRWRVVVTTPLLADETAVRVTGPGGR